MTRVRRATLTALPVVLVTAVVAGDAFRPSADGQLRATPPANPTPAAKDPFAETVRPVFGQFCVGCHNDKKRSGGVSLEPFKSTADTRKARDVWDTVREQLEAKHMPPKNKPQPTDGQRKAVLAWIEAVANKVDCGLARDPGRPTVRRLNRNEYNNTIRDLLGVDFKPAESFPSDDVGYGFDNI